MNVAIYCASVPALKPIFTPRRLWEHRHKNKYRYQGRDDLLYDGNGKKDHLKRGASNVMGRADLQVLELAALSPLERSRMELSSRDDVEEGPVEEGAQKGEPSTKCEDIV